MIVCGSEFVIEDPADPGYSLMEVDFYAWIPRKYSVVEPNHRLSLRKNLRTGEYELYKFYFEGGLLGRIRVPLDGRVRYKDNGVEVVVFSSKNLQEVLDKAYELRRLYHPDVEWERDLECTHEYPRTPAHISSFCKVVHLAVGRR